MEVYCAMISSTIIQEMNYVDITGILLNVVCSLAEFVILEITKLTLYKLYKFIQKNACYLLPTILFPIIYTMGNRIISHSKRYCQLLDRFLSLKYVACFDVLNLLHTARIKISC